MSEKANGRAPGFESVRISIASPEAILGWSHGEVTKADTINQKTFKPEFDGLFCTRIFGPEKDYHCWCGEYQKPKFKGVVCENCGTEVTLAKVRRERMGHVSLAAPVTHTWYLKSAPSVIASLLGLPPKTVKAVAYHEKFIVLDGGNTGLGAHELLSPEQYDEAAEGWGRESFEAVTGASAVQRMLREVDLAAESQQLRTELADCDDKERRKLTGRLRIMEGLLHSGQLPEWMVMTVLPVAPPGLRPLVPIDGERFTSADLNDLYKRVINRNNRLKRLVELRAPERVRDNEKNLLQKSVDALFDNSAAGPAQVKGINNRPLKSLSDTLKGKHGRFRQNMLGKRVDYSGRSVITVGPQLKIHQCGLPKKMAVELFKPHIYAQLEKMGVTQTVKQAKKQVERQTVPVWDALDEVIKDHPVMLNRAPTLHRLGIQAFEPVMISGNALQLHPLVCTAFNADFDGDQMAVHVPLSAEAQLECRVLMMANNNLLHPASGEPIVTPSQDMVLGIYYLSLLNEDSAPRAYANHQEVMFALEYGHIGLHDRIITRYDTVDEAGRPIRRRVATTPGRMIVAEAMPRHPGLPFELCNRKLKKGDVSDLIIAVYRECGQNRAVQFCDRLLSLGFEYSTRSGATISTTEIRKLMAPETKQAFVDKAQAEIAAITKQYADGVINNAEKYKKVLAAWAQCGDEVKAAIEQVAESGEQYLNSVVMMMDSKARGSIAQLMQLIGMKGQVARSDNRVVEQAIASNYVEGFSVTEYFDSCAGGRKGLTDTSLKTADAGYLTRKLTDSARWCCIVAEDCGTNRGVAVGPAMLEGELVVSLGNRIMGRTLAKDIRDAGGRVLAYAGELVGRRLAAQLDAAEIATAEIRSPVTCEALDGKCAACYGTDLARSTHVAVGESIGVMAAQSIGEPGTQLTLRTFHLGGQANVKISSNATASHAGRLRVRNTQLVQDSAGRHVVLSGSAVLFIEDAGGAVLSEYPVPYGAKVESGAFAEPVTVGQVLAEWDPHSRPILAGAAGTVTLCDLVPDRSMRNTVNEETGIERRTVMDWKQNPAARHLNPRIEVASAEGEAAVRTLVPDAVVVAVDGEEVAPGDTVARVELQAAENVDITGGLPRVNALFEGRKPANPAVISAHAGKVKFGETTRSGRKLTVGDSTHEYLIPKARHSHLQDGDHVEVGDMLLEGEPDPQDVLDTGGLAAFTHYMLEGVQSMYREQGVIIDDRHVEVMISCMVQMREVLQPNDTLFEQGETVHCSDLHEADEDCRRRGLQPSQSRILVMGITAASLKSRSWLAAASFQNTKKILTEASVQGRVDELKGVKENILVGRLIPAGTGAAAARISIEAVKRDEAAAELGLPLKAAAAPKVFTDRRRSVDYAGIRHRRDRYSREEEPVTAEAA